MTIRLADASDTTSIVELLKVSLGEALMPKSELFWNWKHHHNPFGKSPVLLAFEGNQLVGVRAFMRWQWSLNGELYPAVRAVDTVTHPGSQGKGIFRKLTLSLVEQMKGSDVSFIFNTPNKLSCPGYLKMGWTEAGRLPVTVRIRKPIGILSALIGKDWRIGPENHDSIASVLDRKEELAALVSEHMQMTPGRMKTAMSVEYLKWRYHTVPVATYIPVPEGGESLNTLVIARIKPSRAGREFRIAEYIAGRTSDPRNTWKLIVQKARMLRADYITASGFQRLPGLGATLNAGPVVTIRDVNGFKHFHDLKNFKEWSPSLGDLELF